MSIHVQIFLLILALFRVYLEVINFQFEKLPLTRKLIQIHGDDISMLKFHRYGLYFSIGYILLTAPFLLVS